jgi:hypothetical protein
MNEVIDEVHRLPFAAHSSSQDPPVLQALPNLRGFLRGQPRAALPIQAGVEVLRLERVLIARRPAGTGPNRFDHQRLAHKTQPPLMGPHCRSKVLQPNNKIIIKLLKILSKERTAIGRLLHYSRYSSFSAFIKRSCITSRLGIGGKSVSDACSALPVPRK